ncbi:MAG TPA: hypothetical protein VIO11_08275 [Candidatus Methanoperedens sp.]
MSSMSEDALFKAILTNKHQQKTESGQKIEPPIRKEVRENIPKSGSEDAMFKVLLRNKPQQQMSQAVVKESIPAPQTPPQPGIQEPEMPVLETKSAQNVDPAQMDEVIQSINSLTASVNIIQGLVRTLIVPLLVLILIVGAAILIRGII